MKTQRFNYKKMRSVFYSWHGGQWSPLYAAASSGLVADTAALQAELKMCAQSMWKDPANIKHFNYVDGKPTQSSMRAGAYREHEYLLRVANALPAILNRTTTVNGVTCSVLPWGPK